MPGGTSINITESLSCIIDHVVSSSTKLGHINMKRVLVCVGSNRVRSRGGTYGKLVPLRFMNGHDVAVFNGKRYAIPHMFHNNERILYLIYFYMPKFFDLPPFEKLKVIFHELFHISPQFNGDIRRMGNVKSTHGFSKKHYDSQFFDELSSFHETVRNSDIYRILEMDSIMLHRSFKKVYARRVPMPRPVLMETQRS